MSTRPDPALTVTDSVVWASSCPSCLAIIGSAVLAPGPCDLQRHPRCEKARRTPTPRCSHHRGWHPWRIPLGRTRREQPGSSAVATIGAVRLELAGRVRVGARRRHPTCSLRCLLGAPQRTRRRRGLTVAGDALVRRGDHPSALTASGATGAADSQLSRPSSVSSRKQLCLLWALRTGAVRAHFEWRRLRRDRRGHLHLYPVRVPHRGRHHLRSGHRRPSG